MAGQYGDKGIMLCSSSRHPSLPYVYVNSRLTCLQLLGRYGSVLAFAVGEAYPRRDDNLRYLFGKSLKIGLDGTYIVSRSVALLSHGYSLGKTLATGL